MKMILIAALSGFLLYSCSHRYGCGTENYRHQFRVQTIKTLKPGDTLVTLRNQWGDAVKLRYECLPDSITLGKIVML